MHDCITKGKNFMKLKKINAVVALITVVLLIGHIVYNTFCYLTMYYNPMLKQIFSVPLMIAVCIHAVLGMMSVFILSDGANLSQYPKLNRKTILQRASAALIFPLLILHINGFIFLSAAAGSRNMFLFFAIQAVNVIFYFDIMIHVALSVSRALITLGILGSREVQEKIDNFCLIAGCVIVVVAAFIIIKGQISIFF